MPRRQALNRLVPWRREASDPSHAQPRLGGAVRALEVHRAPRLALRLPFRDGSAGWAGHGMNQGLPKPAAVQAAGGGLYARRALALDAGLHEGLAVRALEALAGGVGVAVLHLLLLGRLDRSRGRGAVLAQAGLHEGLAIRALLALGVGVAVLHLLLLAAGRLGVGGRS